MNDVTFLMRFGKSEKFNPHSLTTHVDDGDDEGGRGGENMDDDVVGVVRTTTRRGWREWWWWCGKTTKSKSIRNDIDDAD